MLLSSLPSQYETFCVAIESREKISTLDELKVKLLEEEIRKADINIIRDCDGETALLTNKKIVKDNKPQREVFQKPKYESNHHRKFNEKCYTCGKAGHISRHCKNKKRFTPSSRSREEAITAVALNTNPVASDDWCLDSGATVHMCKNKEKFNSINQRQKDRVCTATESTTNSLGRGEVKLNIKIGNTESTIKLSNVMWVPEFRNNLLSVSRITDNGFTVSFNKHSAIIKRKDGTIVLTAQKQNGLYIVKHTEAQQAMLSQGEDDRFNRWHQRLGHLNMKDVRKLIEKDMVHGMKMSKREMENVNK
ncbi:Copia protein [Habropoda laboriosa]|uniref:Copia protein n=1 Tax=Habropoda laboriosa TaxID=597456 RepID=A0A0L7QXV1_9HYME|nr:Copia protein [Habropoda laboriosa]